MTLNSSKNFYSLHVELRGLLGFALKLTAKTLISLLFILSFFYVSTSQADTPKPPAFVEKIANADLFNAIKQGGFVLYMRHGHTDNSRPDRVPSVDLNDCSTQRILNQQGHQVTRQVGLFVRQAGFPIGEVLTSPLCRAQDSAKNAFGSATIELGLMYSGSMTSKQKIPVLAKTRALISTPVVGQTNRVLVAHAPNLMDLIGYFPVEGTLVIFKPKGNQQFDYLGSIRPQDWPALLQPPAPTLSGRSP